MIIYYVRNSDNNSPIFFNKIINETIFTFFYIHKKKVLDSRKFFDFWFSMDLHVLKCPEHDLTILLSSICIRRKYWIRENFSTSGLRWIYMLWDVLNTIWPFLENCLSVCLSVSVCRSVCTILWTLYLKNLWSEIDET